MCQNKTKQNKKLCAKGPEENCWAQPGGFRENLFNVMVKSSGFGPKALGSNLSLTTLP